MYYSIILLVIEMKLRIRDLREDNDLTQQQVAKKIGITQRKYSYIPDIQRMKDFIYAGI